MKRIARILVLVLAAVFSSVAAAEDYVLINNMSTLKWQMTSDGKVWFRNLNEYNNLFLGCCYNYYLDTTTTTGKSYWAMILLKMATGQSLNISVPNKAVSGSINVIGVY